MKTVKYYLDLGVEFVKGDVVIGYKNIEYSKNWHESLQYDDSDEGDVWLDCHIKSFAWRNNDGVKPEYKGVIDAVTVSKHEYKGFSSESELFEFEDDRSDDYVIKWRPVVLQSESPTVSPKEDKTMNQSREPKAIFSTESTMFGDRLREVMEDYEVSGLDVSAITGKPMKPVYTAEMHAKGELPPVDSKVKVCIEEAGFYIDEQDAKFEGKTVTVKAAFSNTESEKIVAVENEDGNCYCYIIECIKPIIKTIKVNGFDVPEPMSEAPKRGAKFYNPSICYHDYFDAAEWIGDENDILWLSRGLIHSTKSAAIAHAKAMLGIDPNA